MTEKKKQMNYVDPAKAASEFCLRGIEYYIAGRFSALAGQSCIVSGNILHHSVEMLLKGTLCRVHTIDEIIKMRHDLTRAWEAFKRAFPDPRLNGFDSAVKDLNKFEDLRYPDDMLSGEMALILKRSHITQTSFTDTEASTGHQYAYVIEDVDELVKLIIEVGSLSLHRFRVLPLRALEMLREHNDHPVL